MKATTVIILVTALAVSLLYSACPTDTPDDNPTDSDRTIVGRLGTGFSPRALEDRPRSIAGAVSTIASFGVVAGQLQPQSPVGVLADGSFSVPLGEGDEGDQVLLFADGAAA